MAITVINKVLSATTGPGLSTTTTAMSTIGANCIIRIICDNQASGVLPPTGGPSTSSPPYDSSLNIWTLVRPADNDGTVTRVGIYYCLNPTTSATHTFTMLKTSDVMTQVVIALSGVDTVGFVDQLSVATTTGATTVGSLAAGSITPTTNNQIVIAMVCQNYQTTAVAPTISGGYNTTSPSTTTNAVANVRLGGGVGYIIQTTATATNPLWTFGGNTKATTVIMSIKAAATANTNNSNFFLFM